MKKIVFFSGLLLIMMQTVHAQWKVTGNDGTSGTKTNYVGTNDFKTLRFAVDSTAAGIITVDSSNSYNTAFGLGTISNIWNSVAGSTGGNNTAMGYHALKPNTTGSNNSAFGIESLESNTIGNGNTGAGAYTLATDTSGSGNTAVGDGALILNVIGNYGSALGYEALYNSTGSENTAGGARSLYNNTTGVNNVAYGYQSLYTNTSIGDETAIGYQALYSSTTGTDNTALGYEVLYLDSTGNYNTGSGFETLYSNTNGNYNTGDGYLALYNNTTSGNYNTAVGDSALYSNTSGAGNTGVGGSALESNTTGSNNTAVGYNAGVNADNYTNASAFGYNAVATASNYIQLGNSSVLTIHGAVPFTLPSDRRINSNIQQNVPGLAFIDQLQPVTFNFDLDAEDKIVQPPVHKDKDGNIIQPSKEELAARAAKEKIAYTGFIAQDVQKAAQSLNYDFSGVDAPKNSKDIYGLRYSDFVVPLVKAVQELSVKNDSLTQTNAALNTKIDAQQNQINALTSEISKIESAMSQCCNSFSSSMQSPVVNQQVSAITDQPRLDQNVPNPFNGSSYISYYIPSGFHTAQLMVTDISGNVLKSYQLANSGYGRQTISGTEMNAGMYQYSLLIDGKLIDTKKMVLAK